MHQSCDKTHTAALRQPQNTLRSCRGSETVVTLTFSCCSSSVIGVQLCIRLRTLDTKEGHNPGYVRSELYLFCNACFLGAWQFCVLDSQSQSILVARVSLTPHYKIKHLRCIMLDRFWRQMSRNLSSGRSKHIYESCRTKGLLFGEQNSTSTMAGKVCFSEGMDVGCV